VRRKRDKFWVCRVAALEHSKRWNTEGSLKIPKSTQKENYRTKCIEFGGGECVFCGYKKCRRALHFHHVDPKTKMFGLGGRGHTTMEKAKVEMAKCILVCANCHSEIHDGLITQEAVLEKFSSTKCWPVAELVAGA
jgi:5-methylcytosine-specific restriction endonuclease McrA